MPKKDFAYYKYRYRFYKEMEEHYRTLYEASRKLNEEGDGMLNTACGEISFHRLCEEYLLSVLNEIEVLCSIEGVTKQIIKGVITNAKERRNIDRIIHTQKLFPNPKGFSNDKKIG